MQYTDLWYDSACDEHVQLLGSRSSVPPFYQGKRPVKKWSRSVRTSWACETWWVVVFFSLFLARWHRMRSVIWDIPSGKHAKNYGKSQFLMGKSMTSMTIFNSYAMLVPNQRVYIYSFKRRFHGMDIGKNIWYLGRMRPSMHHTGPNGCDEWKVTYPVRSVLSGW